MKLTPKTQRICTGDPVDVSSGVVFTAWHDFEFTGFIPIIWRRFYSTSNTALGPLGRGWTNQYFIFLKEDDDKVIFTNDEGIEVLFTKPDFEKPSINKDHQLQLYLNNDNYEILDYHHQLRYFFSFCSLRKVFQIDKIEDYSGNFILIKYNDNFNINKLEQNYPDRTLYFNYDDRDLISEIQIKPPNESPETIYFYEYNSSGELTKAINSLGHSTKYVYDSQHRLIVETNQLGGSFYFEYGKNGRCVRSYGDNGYMERIISHDIDKRVTRITNSLGASTTFHYNEAGVVIKTIDPLGNSFRYNSLPGITQRINPLGHTFEKVFDDRNNINKYTDPLGLNHLYTNNELGLCTKIVDPDGNIRKWNYDENGRMIGYRNPLGNVWKIERGNRGEILNEIDPEGRELKRQYGHNLQWLKISDEIGYYQCHYDFKGSPISSSNSSGFSNIFKTDSLGQITSVVLPDKSNIKYVYDPAGNVTEIKYLDNYTWYFKYDSFDNLISTTDPKEGTVNYIFDTEGRRTSVINKLGETFEEKHDLCGRPIERKYFDGRIEKFGYDSIGQLTHIYHSNGNILRRKYDPYGNMVKETLISIKEGIVEDDKQSSEKLLNSYEYNWKGCILNAQNECSDIGFKYDACGRVIKEWQNEFLINYKYDKSGKLIGRELNNGILGEIKFNYNQAGLINAILDSSGVVQRFNYNNLGLLKSRIFRKDFSENYKYDSRNRLIYQKIEKSYRIVASRKYNYDSSDNVVSINDFLRGSFNYSYDSRGWLTKSNYNNVDIEKFNYDLGGNIIKSNNIINSFLPGSRLTSIGNIKYDYDNNGNLNSIKDKNEETKLIYDSKGRLINVFLPEGDEIKFYYDPLGRRIIKKTPSTLVKYFWSNNKIAGYKEDNKEVVEILVGCGKWRPTVQWVGKNVHHIITNQIGIAQEIFDKQGKIVWWGRHSVFGSLKEEHNDGSVFFDFRFPGQLEDRETGLFYNTNRYYSPLQARYLTPDPVGINAGINLYDYPRNPNTYFDPLGLRCPNPQRVMIDDFNGWEVFRHDDGTLTIRVDCRRAYSNASPNRRVLRGTTHTGEDNAINLPEAHLGRDGRVIVMEGQHRSAAASRGAQIPPDPDNPHLGGVPGRPGYMEYEYSSEFDNGNRVGTPLQDLEYPPEYPHQLPPG